MYPFIANLLKSLEATLGHSRFNRILVSGNGAFFTTPNVLITIHEPVAMTGPLGFVKEVSRLALCSDDREKFIYELRA